MSNQLVWHDRYNIGVDFIDKEHRKLFSIMNKLFAFSEQEMKSQWVCQEGIKYFKGHALKHFTEEEVYMASIEYKGFETHRKLHDNFRQKTLPALEKELERSAYSQEAVSHFLGVCAGWLIGHTLTEDRAITGKAMSKWQDLLPEEEQSAMKQIITRLLQDMFHLNPWIISDNYGGEKFGQGIYYRLSYAADKNNKWEVMLAFEEKLLLNTVGTMIGGKSDKVNTMILNTTRFVARQFVEHIREHFKFSDSYEMKEENLLTYEQFNRIFDRQHPQCSLLFDTGAGYFAFCVVAPHMLKENIGIILKPDNAMAEINKYLKSSEGSKKRKLLIVDDSSSLRQAMQELLCQDYEVTLAKSGMSAIRCVTLNKPDLILLDYEMPICDGRQVLEMLRSETDSADIAVFFLTGRADKATIQKVMALKPDGYLLKTMKPAEIKKNIDDFFNRKRS